MMVGHDLATVQGIQTKLSTQGPREQVYFLMRILPPRLREELRAEQQRRGEREGVSVYAGEIIGPLTPAPEQGTTSKGSRTPGALLIDASPGAESTATTPAARHPQWQRLCDVRLSREHGWQDHQTEPNKVGPRRRAKREAMLQEVRDMPWEWALIQIANGFNICNTICRPRRTPDVVVDDMELPIPEHSQEQTSSAVATAFAEQF